MDASVSFGNMKYLKSNGVDTDDYFHDCIICVTESNRQGAHGFIINRPYPRSLNELQEFSNLPSFPLYEGGPVDAVHLYFLHRRPDLIEGGERISAVVFFGGNFKQVTSAIAKGLLHQNDIRIFLGYCGWDAGDLEQETREGSWEMIEVDVFA